MTAQPYYGISAVHYSDDHDHIESVRVHKISEDKIAKNGIIVGPGRVLTKKRVLEAIASGKKFQTLLKKNGKWVKGQWVNKYTYTETFIRSKQTKPIPMPKDDLEDLPEFKWPTGLRRSSVAGSHGYTRTRRRVRSSLRDLGGSRRISALPASAARK